MQECSVRSDRIGSHSPFTALEMEMRYLICVLTLVLVAPLVAQTGVKPAAEFPVAVHFFDYDETAARHSRQDHQRVRWWHPS